MGEPRDGRETAQNELRMPSEDPLAPAKGFMLGLAIGVAFWLAIILLALVLS